MISDPFWQWGLTVLFSATSLSSLRKLLSARQLSDAIGEVLHLVMALTMIAMCWPWWNRIPPVLQLVIFVIGSLWYLMLILQRLRPSRPVTQLRHLVFHLVMMLAMVWMVAVMLPTEDNTASSSHMGVLGIEAALIGIALTVMLTIAAVMSGVDAYAERRTIPRRDVLDLIAMAAMNTGMGVMCWMMLAH